LFKHFPEGIVVFDLETTGLSPLLDKIVELSAIKLTPYKCKTIDQLINPERPIPPETTEIHGIRDDQIVGSPLIGNFLTDFYDFCEGLPLLAHNAQFDAGFIVFESHKHNIELPKIDVYCSLKMARNSYPHFSKYRLNDLAEQLEIPLESHHHALDDGLASLKIFCKSLMRAHSNPKESRLFKLTDFKKSLDLEIPKHLELIKENIFKQNTIDIKYKGGSMKGKFRPIRPISILPMPKGTILYAHCLVSDLYKSFALSKVAEVRPHIKEQENE
jgi:DNA polymerase III epsilon subunit family exonuclease